MDWPALQEKLIHEPFCPPAIQSDYLKWLEEEFITKEVFYGGTKNQSAQGLPAALLQIHKISYDLLSQILIACYKAARYSPNSDPGSQRRTKTREFREEIPPQIKAIRKLCNIWKRHPEATDQALAQACLRLKTQFNTNQVYYLFIEGHPLNRHQLLQELLQSFAKELEGGKILGVMGDQFLPRFRTGPLLYLKPLDGQKAQPQARSNGLLFHLTFLFRWHTDAKRVEKPRLQPGVVMHQGGKSHFPLVAVLAEATLGDAFLPAKAQKRIRDLSVNGVSWLGWPPTS